MQCLPSVSNRLHSAGRMCVFTASLAESSVKDDTGCLVSGAQMHCSCTHLHSLMA